jgi:SAM-dependent methyltransferase
VNPFDDPASAARYESWYEGSGSRAAAREEGLLRRLLLPGARSILEVGSGTGHFSRWFRDLGYMIVGLDLSVAMLAEAHRRNGVGYILGDAASLPFADRTFDVVALITTLEFVPDARQALTEAGRVARHGLLLGVLNRHSLLTWKYRRSGKPLWKSARFFTVRELTGLVRGTLRERVGSVRWRTALWPWNCDCELPLPWGAFIGMAVELKSAVR